MNRHADARATEAPTNQSSPGMVITCGHCGKRLEVQGRSAGTAFKCPHCLHAIEVPVDPQDGSRPTRPMAGLPHTVETVAQVPRDKGDLCKLLAPPQLPGEIGRLGAYRVFEILGTGGMGVVFRAEDMNLQRQVALKAMLPALAIDPHSKERFLREARAAASVKHDNVVTIHQVDEDRGIPFLAMELLQGESLASRLASGARRSNQDTLRIGREIAAGLDAAHAKGLVHRDIKPGNIWLESPGGRVKILDFGLARAPAGSASLTGEGIIIGTPAYMCPEQASGRLPDARGDLFSLGCVLYAMCAGSAPFRGLDAVSTLVAVVSQVPQHVRTLDPSLPREFADLVMHLLEKKPEDRPSTARTVANRIADLESNKAARRGRRPKRAAERSRPALPWRTWAAVASGLALFAVFAAAAVTLAVVSLARPAPDGSTRPEEPPKKGPEFGPSLFPGEPKGPKGDWPPPKGPPDKKGYGPKDDWPPPKGPPDKKGYGPKGPPPEFAPPPPEGKEGQFIPAKKGPGKKD
jgi:serine/threonine protein kinase